VQLSREKAPLFRTWRGVGSPWKPSSARPLPAARFGSAPFPLRPERRSRSGRESRFHQLMLNDLSSFWGFFQAFVARQFPILVAEKHRLRPPTSGKETGSVAFAQTCCPRYGTLIN